MIGRRHLARRAAIGTAGGLCAAALALAAAGCGDAASTDAAPASTGASREAAAASPEACPEVSPSLTYGFEFRNESGQPITLQVPPGWRCYTRNDGGWVGTSTPASLSGTTVAPGQSVTRTLEFAGVPVLKTQGRFDVSFAAGNASGAAPTIPIAFGGRRDGGGWWGFGTIRPDGRWSCSHAQPVTLADGSPATITVDAYSAKGISSRKSCGDDPVRITIAPR